MGWLAGLFTGGGSIFASIGAKIVMGLLVFGLISGAFLYVNHLRSEVAILTANTAVLQGSVDSEVLKNVRLRTDITAIQIINKNTSIKWADLDKNAFKFNQQVEKTTKEQVQQIIESKGDPKVLDAVTVAVNKNLAANMKCTQVASVGPSIEDKQDPELLRVCPEILK